MTIVKQKQQELHETQKIADQAKTMKKQLSKLEEIIDDLQSKNKELNELLNKKMIERAETYKQQVVDFLNKPKVYECDFSQGARRPEKAEFSTKYRQLGEDLNKDTISPARREQQEAHRKPLAADPTLLSKSMNERSMQDVASKPNQRFESEYARHLQHSSVGLSNEGGRKHVPNSEKKRAHFEDYGEPRSANAKYRGAEMVEQRDQGIDQN